MDIIKAYLVANSMDDFASIEQGEVIRRVFNYGEAFFDSDNNDWKNYHRAILPINQTDVGSIQRLMKYTPPYMKTDPSQETAIHSSATIRRQTARENMCHSAPR